MKVSRGDRLNSLFQKEIYNLINVKLRNKYSSMSAVISVTQVDCAPDLKNAKVYISIYDTNAEKKDNTFAIIKDNASFIRHELAQIMHLRTVPVLHFILDGSMEYGSKIDTILNNLHIAPESDKNDES